MQRYDVVVLGGGHNALTAAAYLARAGRRVLLLERADHLGGAAVSERPFDGVDARLSRYSYLVSLLPRTIARDLDLDVTLVRRRFSSYTPDPHDPARGLLVDSAADAVAHRAAFARVGAEHDAEPWARWYAGTAALARALAPTLIQPLPTRAEVRERFLAEAGVITRTEADAEPGADADADADAEAEALWRDLVERPLGEALDRRFASDLVRGVVATDALIGTFADLHERSLAENRCYLYHVIGGGTGDWDVPVGGMGTVSGALARAASSAGAELLTGAEVVAVSPSGEVRFTRAGRTHEVSGAVVLAGLAPAVLDRLLAEDAGTDPASATAPEGAQVKVNLVLDRLPRLRDTSVDPAAAFAGTFHVHELASELTAAFARAAGGAVPDPLPCEIYCHTLSDRSILGPELAASGAQTLTVFGLHTPHRLVAAHGNDALREALRDAVLRALDSVLAEPVLDVVAHDAHGNPCVEVRTTLDVERSVGMPGGHIFHGPLAWPWREDAAPDGERSPAQRWGVATAHERILLCGSGAVRGGAVSGLGGHNAAQAVLEQA
ncbi:NAD(P)/FAD-dependent oxidoreductase [Miniimonas sp. S16]|uniref:phytoene desaturase family protein n=1 Tax=Miniimonas sp. S16 TaxID=2171623 RepID=UPI000D526EB0|nr:NAD(P)/FAD-dependent oxidoreductase [Miniimonas sp. S16]